MAHAHLAPLLEAFRTSISNAGAAPPFASLFLPHAVVFDSPESATHRGEKSILAWAQDAIFSANGRIEYAQGASASAGAASINAEFATVPVRVSYTGNNAPSGGPLSFWFHFTFFKDKIWQLVVTADGAYEPELALAAYVPQFSELRAAVIPQPLPHPGWRRVRMRYATLNYHDVFTLRGFSTYPLHAPLTLGLDGVGELDDGTRVAVYPLLHSEAYEGDDETLSPTRHTFTENAAPGTMAAVLHAPERNLIALPPDMDLRTAATTLNTAWITAWRMLFTLAAPSPGSKLLVLGCSGGVATALILLGVAAGFRVFCTGRTEEKRTFARGLGVEGALAPGEEPSDGGFEAVFSVAGGKTLGEAVSRVKAGGRVVVCGGHMEDGFTAELELIKIVVEGVVIKGAYLGTRKEMKELMGFVQEKGIKGVGEAVGVDEVVKAVERMEKGEVRGKVLVRMRE